jgi:sodium/proline symporter
MIFKVGGVIVYLAILLWLGVLASRRMKDIKDYFAAGKNLGFWSVAFSARATGESAWLLIGLTGMGCAIGVKAFWVVVGEVIGVVGAWVLMSKRFKRLTDQYDSITIPDYLESRFQDKSQIIRIVSALALTIFVTIYVSAQIDATGKAFEDFLGWNYYVGIGVGFAVVVTYITSGGFLAVAWSDVFQGALMFFGLVILPIVAIASMGGVSALTDGLSKIDVSLLSITGGVGWTPLVTAEILGLALIGLGFLGSPQIFVRFIALKNESEILKGTAVAFIWTLLADSGAVLIGMAGRVMLSGPGGDMAAFGGQEAVLPALVEHVFPALIVGIYIAIVLSAIMSTVDSLLILAGSAVVRDWYQKVKNPTLSDEALVGLSRKVTFALALGGLAVALIVAATTPDRTVFWFVIFGWSGISATFCPVMILSLFWSGLTGRGVVAGMITGFLAVPLFKFVVSELPGIGEFFTALNELPPSFALAFLMAIVVSLTDKKGQVIIAQARADLDAAKA